MPTWTSSSDGDGGVIDAPPVPSEDPRADVVRVGVAAVATTTTGRTLTTSGLGSCVGVAVADERDDRATGGLLHAMLPTADSAGPTRRDVPAKFVDAGLDVLVEALREVGSDPAHLVAKVAGGSAMLDVAIDDPIGERNVAAVETHLGDRGVPLVASDVGGTHGRSLAFEVSTGTLRVTGAHGPAREL